MLRQRHHFRLKDNGANIDGVLILVNDYAQLHFGTYYYDVGRSYRNALGTYTFIFETDKEYEFTIEFIEDEPGHLTPASLLEVIRLRECGRQYCYGTKDVPEAYLYRPRNHFTRALIKESIRELVIADVD